MNVCYRNQRTFTGKAEVLDDTREMIKSTSLLMYVFFNRDKFKS